MIALGSDYSGMTETCGDKPFEMLRDVDRGTKIWMSLDLESDPRPPVPLPARQSTCVAELSISWVWSGTELLTLGEVGSNVCKYRLVFMDAEPTLETELNAWYDEEHLPGLISVAGVQWAVRYRARTASPRYLAVYGLDTLEVCDTSEWRSVGNTPWSNRIRPAIVNRYRSDCTVWESAVESEGK